MPLKKIASYVITLNVKYNCDFNLFSESLSIIYLCHCCCSCCTFTMMVMIEKSLTVTV